MIYSSKQSSFLWLWWRRQTFYLRRVSLVKVIVSIVVFLVFVTKLPNPFSSQYSRIPIQQNIRWDNIDDLLNLKQNIVRNDPVANRVKVIREGIEQTSLSSNLILLFTNIFLEKRYCHSKLESIFGQSCPSKSRCQWTCDNRKLSEADVIIFHAYDIQFYHALVPDRSKTKKGSLWILWSDEPPSMVDYALFKPYRFNWTISYKLTSEVSIGSYGLFSKRDIIWSNSEYNHWVNEQFNYRSKDALWFVSNCNSKKRLKYYHSLTNQKMITVEGYGRCVDYYPMHLCGAGTQCERDYMSKFKFYFSFESTTCRDYITEKFFKAFHHGLIPVVLGPDRADYNKLAPNNSFIHINDFDQDMTKLAKYLHEVSSDLDLYRTYHQWRKTHDVIVDGRALERIRMCELCERLSKRRPDDITYYENIELFYLERCLLLITICFIVYFIMNCVYLMISFLLYKIKQIENNLMFMSFF